MNDDLISRQAAIKSICEDGTWLESQGCTEITMAERKQRDADIISDLPSVERKKGRWKTTAVDTFDLAYGGTGYEPVFECSICGRVTESYLRLDEPIMPDDADFPNFCPWCGAEMENEP